MIELVVRLAFSLAVVLGLLTVLARFGAKRFRGSTDAPIRVVTSPDGPVRFALRVCGFRDDLLADDVDKAMADLADL